METGLLGGAGVVAAGLFGVEQGVLPGRPWLQEHLRLDGPDGVIPDVEPGRVVEDSFVSEARGGVEVGWSLILPPGVSPRDSSLPLVVALHWLGADNTTLTGSELGLDRYLAAHAREGGQPFAIVAADGGSGYWHPHKGDDAGSMVLEELLPMVRNLGYDIGNISFLGWSMGGYGALRLAAVRGDRTPAVVASSPALWKDAGDASSSGFSDAHEYDEYSVFHHQESLNEIPVRVDIGTGDPFYRDVQKYVDDFPYDHHPTATFERGGHTPGYWRRMLPAQLDWLGKRV
jgi:pimeloyl-ACP methyl ester carboxylesterase